MIRGFNWGPCGYFSYCYRKLHEPPTDYQYSFFDRLKDGQYLLFLINEFDKAESDFAFFLYDLVPENKTKVLSLKLQRVVYTKFANALEQIAKFEAGSISQFTEMLQKKLDAKRAGVSDIDNLENIVVE